MKLALHVTRLGFRGNSNAVYQYAHHAQALLGCEAVLCLEAPLSRHEAQSLDYFGARFELLTFKDLAELEQLVRSEKIDLFYSIKPGWNDGLLPRGCRNGVHAMNSFMEPHGDSFAFVSAWQSRFLSQGRIPFVPHIVAAPSCREQLRDELGIPGDALVIGRHGGDITFDLPFVQQAVQDFAAERPDCFFLFLNTQRFCPPRHNIIFLPGMFDAAFKDRFINSCDVMLHARTRGETFGLAVAEFAAAGKRILTWGQSVEQAHFDFLGPSDQKYYQYADLLDILRRLAPLTTEITRPQLRAYSPAAVMAKFEQIFLSTAASRLISIEALNTL